jgi:hypothetical protein
VPLAGRQLSIGWALALCQHVGFRGKNLTIAVALMTAESGRFTEAWHENFPGSAQMSVDRGLFQINDHYHTDLSEADAFNAVANARYAFKMSSGQYFTAWMAYVNGAHTKYLPLVFAVRVLGRWKRKVRRVERELG